MSKFFIRTPRNLGDYQDYTNTGPGLTDQSQHETMLDLVERVLRGEVRTKNQLIYDFDEDCKLSEDEQFDSMDVTQTDGFDLADAPVVMDVLKSQIEKDQLDNGSAPSVEPSEDVEAPTQSNETDEKGSE